MKSGNFFAELKRRNVYKVAVAYAVAGWALSQGIAQVFPVFDIPNWAIRSIVLLIILGFPVAVGLGVVVRDAHRKESNARKRPTRCAPACKATEIRLDLRCRHWRRSISIGLFFLGRYTCIKYDAGAARSETATSSRQVNSRCSVENISDG